MVKRNTGLLLLFLIPLILVSGCNDQNQPKSSRVVLPAQTTSESDPILGKLIYASKCASCHGKGGEGSNQGPPLVHKIYEQGHHADYSFYVAVARGVQSHHWRFGDMPAISDVSPENVAQIIAYIRQEQRLVGIK